MKYSCPECGAEIVLGADCFCHNCGTNLNVYSEEKPAPFKPKDIETDEQWRDVSWKIPHREIAPKRKSEYDGYYDDIIPEDGDVHYKEKLDPETIKKIAIIIAGVITVAIVCTIALILM